MTDRNQPPVSLTGRLAARAVTLSLDAANAPEDIVDNLLRLSHREAALLHQAVRQVEHRHRHPESAQAQLAIQALRMAAVRAADKVAYSSVSTSMSSFQTDASVMDGGA